MMSAGVKGKADAVVWIRAEGKPFPERHPRNVSSSPHRSKRYNGAKKHDIG